MAGKTRLLIAIAALGWSLGLTETGHAQQMLAMPRIGGYSAAPDTTLGAGGVGRPAVSPYTNLPMIDALAIPGGYQTLVQPFVNQNQVNNVQQSSINRLQRQVTNVATATSTSINTARRPGQIIRDTGHPTRSMNYSHYFPTANP
jgi:hypothetical protein